MSDFIENNIVIDRRNETCCLYHQYDWLNMKKPWCRALVQGLLASVMIRRFVLTEERKYLALSEMASNTLIPVGEGGVAKKN